MSDIIETGQCGFNYDGTLDKNTSFTHTVTYIPVAGNENATVTWGGIEGWLRYIFYNANKEYIGQYTGETAQTSQSISQLISIAPHAVYIRMSINQTVPGFYGLTLKLPEEVSNIKIAPCGFLPNGELDTNTTFTHMVTFAPIEGNENATIMWGGITGWTRYIFYDANKNVIGSLQSNTSVVSVNMSDILSSYPLAVYFRMSINKTVPGFYGLTIENTEETPLKIANIKVGASSITKVLLGVTP
ncbi:MAG: hypothetical protein J6D47_00450, partial [Peptostreptococcaceae bacterium]|nr:hypothetical protein [Peptostreptococcaceae bacterium]